jgi:hypothetical protein
MAEERGDCNREMTSFFTLARQGYRLPLRQMQDLSPRAADGLVSVP